jgi:hypothetical protein
MRSAPKRAAARGDVQPSGAKRQRLRRQLQASSDSGETSCCILDDENRLLAVLAWADEADRQMQERGVTWDIDDGMLADAAQAVDDAASRRVPCTHSGGGAACGGSPPASVDACLWGVPNFNDLADGCALGLLLDDSGAADQVLFSHGLASGAGVGT